MRTAVLRGACHPCARRLAAGLVGTGHWAQQQVDRQLTRLCHYALLPAGSRAPAPRGPVQPLNVAVPLDAPAVDALRV